MPGLTFGLGVPGPQNCLRCKVHYFTFALPVLTPLDWVTLSSLRCECSSDMSQTSQRIETDAREKVKRPFGQACHGLFECHEI